MFIFKQLVNQVFASSLLLMILSIDSFLVLNFNIEFVHIHSVMFYYVLRFLGSNDSVIVLPLIKLFVLEFG